MKRYPFQTCILSTSFPLLVPIDKTLIVTIIVLSAIIVILCGVIIRLRSYVHKSHKSQVGDAISRQMFEVWPLGVLVISPNGMIEDMNKSLQEELRLEIEKIVGKPAINVIEVIQDKVNLLPQYLKRIRQGERMISFSDNCFIRKAGTKLNYLVQGAVVGVYIDDKLVKIICHVRNVEEELVQEYISKMALSRTKIFPWYYNLDENKMIIDIRWFQHLGIPVGDCSMGTDDFAAMIHPDDRGEVIEALSLQLAGILNKEVFTYRLKRGDGGWEWFQAQSVYLGQINGIPYRVVGVCQSIQEHKMIENNLIAARDKAQRSDELKSAFLANMSHEIRTPLNAIVGFSTLLVGEQNTLSSNEIEDYASLIEKNGQLLMYLISDILDLSKIESNTMEFNIASFSLNKLFTDIASMQKLNVKPDVDLILDIPEKDIMILADSVRLGQVVNNLINNAVKFTLHGSIRIGYSELSEESVQLFVEDTGKGMPEEVLTHIFERFYKGDSFVQGTGLGLAICKTIVQHFGGRISAKSKLGEGARFEVLLPVGEE